MLSDTTGVKFVEKKKRSVTGPPFNPLNTLSFVLLRDVLSDELPEAEVVHY